MSNDELEPEMLLSSFKIGFLHSGSKASFRKHYRAFRRRLDELIDDDVKIDDRWVEDTPGTSLSQHAQQLAATNALVIVAAGGPGPAIAARDATGTPTLPNRKPVVFTTVVDPVGTGSMGGTQPGLVIDLDNPQTNLTGTAGLTSELDVTRLELLNELLVRASGTWATIGVLNYNLRDNLAYWKGLLDQAAIGMKLTLRHRDVGNIADIQNAFGYFRGAGAVDAVLVTADALFNSHRREVIALSAAPAPALRTIYQWREFVEDGGLMSYGPSIIEAYEETAEFVKRILVDGKKPQDNPPTLPVSFPEKLELVMNMRFARKNNITIPASLLTRPVLVRNRLS
jgi:putative ABC transport system substrate-binding protein